MILSQLAIQIYLVHSNKYLNFYILLTLFFWSWTSRLIWYCWCHTSGGLLYRRRVYQALKSGKGASQKGGMGERGAVKREGVRGKKRPRVEELEVEWNLLCENVTKFELHYFLVTLSPHKKLRRQFSQNYKTKTGSRWKSWILERILVYSENLYSKRDCVKKISVFMLFQRPSY